MWESLHALAMAWQNVVCCWGVGWGACSGKEKGWGGKCGCPSTHTLLFPVKVSRILQAECKRDFVQIPLPAFFSVKDVADYPSHLLSNSLVTASSRSLRWMSTTKWTGGRTMQVKWWGRVWPARVRAFCLHCDGFVCVLEYIYISFKAQALPL